MRWQKYLSQKQDLKPDVYRRKLGIRHPILGNPFGISEGTFM